MTFMIDSPAPFESLEIWEQYLDELRSMPGCGLKQVAIEHAERFITEKKQILNTAHAPVRAPDPK
ncbi:hypothetical protein [Bradyrhizobium sp. 15]|uniref:hypothetical protein n=1 Tax=Bradyrhizobium sp. 15 TaxID=2782633 RepID=UPI001FF9C231|nr:hypothetical protein [Bradyrhizobium sp. 15]MCK1437066.1 hypothetical protein [Bradyrhizobium sp. 15]